MNVGSPQLPIHVNVSVSKYCIVDVRSGVACVVLVTSLNGVGDVLSDRSLRCKQQPYPCAS